MIRFYTCLDRVVNLLTAGSDDVSQLSEYIMNIEYYIENATRVYTQSYYIEPVTLDYMIIEFIIQANYIHYYSLKLHSLLLTLDNKTRKQNIQIAQYITELIEPFAFTDSEHKPKSMQIHETAISELMGPEDKKRRRRIQFKQNSLLALTKIQNQVNDFKHRVNKKK